MLRKPLKPMPSSGVSDAGTHWHFRTSSSNRPHSSHSSVFPTKSLFYRLLGPFALLVVGIVFLQSQPSMFWNNKDKQKPETVTHVSSAKSSDAAATNRFAFRLFDAVAQKSTDVLISPASVSSALSLPAAGVTSGSNAEKQFAELLPKQQTPISSMSSSDVSIDVATSAWLEKNVLSSFQETAKKLGADIRTAPFTSDDINKWVSEKTKGKIPTILDQLPNPLVAIIVNAIYFKGSWTSKFDKDATAPLPFKGVSKPIPFMRKREFSVPYARIAFDSSSVGIADVPYGKDKPYSAMIVVPQDSLNVDTVIKRLGEEPQLWEAWTGALSERKLNVLALPRFKLEYGVKSMKDALTKLGLKDAFTSNIDSPPFKGVSDDPRVYIEDVLHKATMECTEEGTVASAATAVVMRTRSLMIGGPELIADRPFLFAIRERASGLILFLARIDKPVNP